MSRASLKWVFALRTFSDVLADVEGRKSGTMIAKEIRYAIKSPLIWWRELMNRSNRRRTRNQVYLCTYQWHLTNGKLCGDNFHCSYFHFSQFPLSLSKHSYFFFSSLSSALLSTYCALLQKQRAHILNYILNTRVEGSFLFCLYKCIQLSSRLQ